MNINSQLVDSAKQCADLIKKSSSIGVLTGAGISTNAGIPDFRGPQGLYVTKKYDADKIFDINYFYRDPKPFYEFARDFVQLEEKIQPTFTHRFLRDLEKQGKISSLITQNIDALHKKAGSESCIEVHGSIWTSTCLDCADIFNYDQMKQKLFTSDIPRCSCTGVIKPDIVFFGEDIKNFSQAIKAARESDLFFVIGTSCVVYPAALIPESTSADIVVVNRDSISLRTGHVVLSVQEDIDLFFQKVSEYLSQMSTV